jgi:hypothetical protein
MILPSPTNAPDHRPVQIMQTIREVPLDVLRQVSLLAQNGETEKSPQIPQRDEANPQETRVFDPGGCRWPLDRASATEARKV